MQSPTLLLSNPRKAGGDFVLDISGLTAGKSVVLEARSTLADSAVWVPFRTNVASAPAISMTNPVAPGAAFFRACQLP